MKTIYNSITRRIKKVNISNTGNTIVEHIDNTSMQ